MIFISLLILIVAIALKPIYIELNPKIITRITSLIFIYSAALSFNVLYFQNIGRGIGIFSGLFEITLVSQYIDIFLFIIAALILVSWPNNKVIQINTESIEYSLIILFSSIGSSLLISSNDLISMYLSIELQSFGLYILSTIYRNSSSATSAGLKYFLLGCLASCLILFGSGLVYSFTGLTNFESLSIFSNVISFNQVNSGLNLGYLIIFIGFLFKIAAAPLHFWAPSVYDESPTIITIWLTIMPKISIIIFLLVFFYNNQLANINTITQTDLDINYFIVIKYLILICSLFSLIIGTIVGLAQNKIKKLLAYSTISHVGFLLLALAINTQQSTASLIFYILQYTLTNLNTFLILIAFGYIAKNSLTKLLKSFHHPGGVEEDRDIQFISELTGQFYSNPILSLSFTICLLSTAGIPPFLGFFAKQFVLSSALDSGYFFMSFVGIFVSVISTSYYLKIIKVLHQFPTNKVISIESNTIYNITNVHSFIISTLTLLIIMFILNPSLILNSTLLLSLSLFSH